MGSQVQNGVSKLDNDSIGQASVWGAPGGIVYGKDGQVLRAMLATVQMRAGDVVLLDVATGPYNVTKTAVADSPLRYGVVVGGAVGTTVVTTAQITAGNADIWVCIEGAAWGAGATGIAIGDQVSTSAVAAGLFGTGGGSTSLQPRQTLSLPATVSNAASIVSYSYLDTKIAVTGALTGDIAVNFSPVTSLPANMLIGAVWQDSSTSFGIRLGNPASVPITSFASIPGFLTVTRAAPAGIPGAVLGVAITSATAASGPAQVFVAKR